MLEFPAIPSPSERRRRGHPDRPGRPDTRRPSLRLTLHQHEVDIGVTARGDEALPTADRDLAVLVHRLQLGVVEMGAGTAFAERAASPPQFPPPFSEAARPLPARLRSRDRRRRHLVHQEHHPGRCTRRPDRLTCLGPRPEPAAHAAVLLGNDEPQRSRIGERAMASAGKARSRSTRGASVATAPVAASRVALSTPPMSLPMRAVLSVEQITRRPHRAAPSSTAQHRDNASTSFANPNDDKARIIRAPCPEPADGGLRDSVATGRIARRSDRGGGRGRSR